MKTAQVSLNQPRSKVFLRQRSKGKKKPNAPPRYRKDTVILDGFPVTPYHMLIIPKRHVSTYFEISHSESNACHSLINKAKSFIEKEDSEVSGFNIGINNGESAGQTILHCHIHLIPRRKNDVEKPRGGIRNVIPGKGDY